jgi:short-subunit dehydrogenase
MAREFGRRGARLTLVARASDELEKVAVDVGAVALPGDLSNLSDLEGLEGRATEANGPIDVLVNNAALGMSRHFGTLSADDVRQCITTNLLAPMELSRQVLVGMLDRDRGTIANISSVAGELAVPHLACYSASKAGLTTFSLDLQRDLKRSNIAVMVFVLGAVPGTQIYHESLQNEVIHAVAQQLEKVSKITPEGVARRVADAVASEKRRAVVTIPGTSAPLLWWRHLPARLGDRFF